MAQKRSSNSHPNVNFSSKVSKRLRCMKTWWVEMWIILCCCLSCVLCGALLTWSCFQGSTGESFCGQQQTFPSSPQTQGPDTVRRGLVPLWVFDLEVHRLSLLSTIPVIFSLSVLRRYSQPWNKGNLASSSWYTCYSYFLLNQMKQHWAFQEPPSPPGHLHFL